jgi:VanZ family protein
MQLGFILYVLAVVVASLVPARSVSTPGAVDKVGHFIAYTIMTYLGLIAFKSRAGSILVVLFSISLGIVLELLQSLISGRDASIADGLANFIGIFFGAGVYIVNKAFSDRG